MKTLAQLKRDAKDKKISLEMVEWYGQKGNEIPERLRGVRKVIGANTVALILLNADGKESELRPEAASLVEYDDDTLTVYASGYRDLTEKEREILAAWEAEEKAYLEKNSMADTFWKKKHFFMDRGYEWLLGFSPVNGKIYNAAANKVRDRAVRGVAILKYKVYRG